MFNKKIFTVSELNAYLKNKIEEDSHLNKLLIKGEISNFKAHSSGHLYFVLKDDKSSVRCVMFRSRASKLRFLPEHGLEVLIGGYLSLYERDGNFQIYVEKMEPAGIGELHLAFEQLKNKLAQEGLFSEELKKPLPFLPRKIGVVTSPTGAVWQDIQKVALARYPNLHLVLAPAAVQGDSAPEEIARGLSKLNAIDDVDLIIVGRGGGSLEDLWAFNTEIVARAIFNSLKPVISAVGHQTDVTIADFVADQRAVTPSAAAEMAVPVKKELLNDLKHWSQRLAKNALAPLNLGKERLNHLRQNSIFQQPNRLLEDKIQYFDDFREDLVNAGEGQFKDFKNNLEIIGDKLNVLSPLTTLARGYAICQSTKENKVITSSQDVQVGDGLKIILAKGSLTCQVKEQEEGVRHGQKN